MAGSRIQKNKPHKTRFASKTSRHAHRSRGSDGKGTLKGVQRHISKEARAVRVQRSKMVRDQKRAALLAEKRASCGPRSPPRIIVLFALSSNVVLTKLMQRLLAVLASDGPKNVSDADIVQTDEVLDYGNSKLMMDIASYTGHKIRATVMEAPREDLQTCLEMAKVADIILFVASAYASAGGGTCNSYIDSMGNQCLSMFRAQGLPSTVGVILDLPDDPKKKQDAKRACISSLSAEFPEDCKILPAESVEDCQKLVRQLSEQRISAPQWRNQRSFVMAQQVDIVPDELNAGKSNLLLSGYVRARCLSVNQLVYVPGAGDFQLCQIDVLEDPLPLHEHHKHKMDSVQLDNNSQSEKVMRTLLPDISEQELVVIENVPDPLAGEQTWPTEEEMVEADNGNKQKKMKKRVLPRGTSDYQAAWIVDETDEEQDIDDENEPVDGMVMDREEQGDGDHEGSTCLDEASLAGDQISLSFTLKDYDEETQTDMMVDDENLTEAEMQAEIQRLKAAHAQDKEFPDEMDTPTDVPARQRFAKFRGLKSFRTSLWDPKESLPEEYARIFAFDNFARTHKHVLVKAKEVDNGDVDGCASVGAYVRLHIKGVPLEVATKLLHTFKKKPVVACGLFQHESKMSVLHFSIKKHDSYTDPIKSKEALIFHVGFRQFSARPVFSSDDINADKHKLERFLHPGRFSVASVFAPICFPPLPLIAFKDNEGEAARTKIAAFGCLKTVDPDRIILKKVILTGYPQRVSKVKAIVRFMFHNPEDVRWFRPVELWTKYGRCGRIKEPVGTHGAMKCIFDGVVQQRDTVCLSLYKRVYPKWPEQH